LVPTFNGPIYEGIFSNICSLLFDAYYTTCTASELPYSIPKKDVRKAVRNKTNRKTKNEMAGRRFHYLRKMGISQLRDRARDRETRRRIIEEAKAHPGL
jgi:hypothetical protein